MTDRTSRSHRLLQRQLRKAGVEIGAPEMATFLTMVEESYEEFDDHRRLTEHSTRLASDELSATIDSLEESETLFRSLTRCSPNGIIYTGPDGECLYANEKAQELIGRPESDLLGGGWRRFVPDEELQELLKFITADGTDRLMGSVVEHRLLLGDGGAIWSSTSVASVVDSNGRMLGWVAHLEDVTERKVHERELSRLARQDSLTQLDNRHALNQRLAELCSGLDPHECLAVALIDLDRFKLVNDSFGHETGDQLLMRVADKLSDVARKDDIVARLGGDEFAFVAVLDNPDSADITRSADALGQRLADALHGAVQVDGRVVHVSGSVGIAIGRDYPNPQSLLRDADTAMYRAKRSRITRHQLFDETFREEVTSRFALESELRSAIEHREIKLAFQPVANSLSHEVTTVEALARWDNERLGSVRPLDFIPVAEDLGLIGELGRQLLDMACQQLAAWRTESDGLEELKMAVNVSPLQLVDPTFAGSVRSVLAAASLRPADLVLEITEGALLDDFDHAAEVLDDLRSIGVLVAIDDFGTGYSSLSYLERLPVDFLKIDQSFVQAMGLSGEHESSNRLTETIIDLAIRFGLTPVAEGVETELQQELLQGAGCDLIQGYLLAEPMAGDDDRLRQLLLREIDPAKIG